MQNPLAYLIGILWQYSSGNHPRVVLYMSMSIIANLLSALDPIVVGLFLNTLQVRGVHESTFASLCLFLGALMVLELGFWAFHGPSRILENANAFRVRKVYKNYLLSGVMALPIEWHTDHHSGDTIDKIEKGTTALYNFSERTFEVIQGVITLATAYLAMFIFDWRAGAAALTISIVTFYVLTLFDRRLVPGYTSVNRMENATSAKIFDALSNVTTVIILRVESLVLKAITQFIDRPFAAFCRNNKINEWKWFTAALCGRLAVVTVVGIYLFSHVTTGTILVGTMYIVYGYANQIRDTFFRFAYLYNDIVRYRASVSNTEELSRDFAGRLVSDVDILPKEWRRIALTDLSFSYHAAEGADLHLDHVSLSFERGERVALIGESGGGKTTLLKVIRNLYVPKSGTVSVDGTLLQGGCGEIKNSIALVPQDPEIFATTIRENLTLGVDYTDEHLAVYTDLARLTSVIERLPKKLESSIVEKGVNLSGGEKQRLALARGLLASTDKDILLLDEPTSSVDFQNELDIFKDVFQAFPRQTIIASIHRLHLLSLFDTVHVFANGQLVASGTFESLKATSPEFRTLWDRYIATRDAA